MHQRQRRRAKKRLEEPAASIFVRLFKTIPRSLYGRGRRSRTSLFFVAGLIIAVVIGVVVVVLVVLKIDIVEHDSEDCSANTEDSLFDAGQHRAGKTAMLNDDYGLVHLAG